MALNDLKFATRLTKEEQFFFLNDNQVSGVQSVSINYTNNNTLLKFIGMGFCTGVPRGPQVGGANLSIIPIANDYFLPYTGNSGFNGYVVKDISNPAGENFSFTSGYVTSYTSRASIGQIPQIEVGIDILGNIGLLAAAESSQVSDNFDDIIAGNGDIYNFKVVAPGDLSLNLGDYNTNRLLSYDLSINSPRNPTYILGKRGANEAKNNLPIEINLSFQFAVDTYTGKKLNDFPCTRNKNSISITLNDYNTSTPFITYTFNDMELVGEEYTTNVDGQSEVTVRYRKYQL